MASGTLNLCYIIKIYSKSRRKRGVAPAPFVMLKVEVMDPRRAESCLFLILVMGILCVKTSIDTTTSKHMEPNNRSWRLGTLIQTQAHDDKGDEKARKG